LFMMEAMLTGESVAIEKQVDDTVFMGTIVQ
jgi:cation transport ATPase